MGLVAKALTPDFVYDDLACLTTADPGNATTDDTDDDGKPAPQTHSTCRFGDFAKAIHVTGDMALPHSLMLVHALAVSDAAAEPRLPRDFLPNAETGPPAGIALGATTASCADWLLGTVGTVTRSGRLPRPPLSHPQQTSRFLLAARRNQKLSFVMNQRQHTRENRT